MSDESFVIVMAAGPNMPERCATPFYMASMAAAEGFETIVYCTSMGTLLVKKGVAETVFPMGEAAGQSVADFMKMALNAGVKLGACMPSMEMHGMTEADLIPEAELISAAAGFEVIAESDKLISF
jgi:predicted peroxiredoxin